MENAFLESWCNIYPKQIPALKKHFLADRDSFSTNTNNLSFKVFVRINPSQVCEVVIKSDELGFMNTVNGFRFNGIFTKDDTPEVIHSKVIGDILCNEGQFKHNITIFCFGATGSGKSYTLLNERDGLVQMTAFENLTFPLKMSCVEIYKEKLTDLLKMSSSSASQVSRISVGSIDEAMKYIILAARNRVTKVTDFNPTSSRSHLIITFYDDIRQINFVDLAGSEKYTTQDLDETTSINKSLLALRRVVSCLSNKNSHIPYRDSLLTMFLQNSLGGNCITVLIATIGGPNTAEINRTLKFAAKASFIENQIINPDKEPCIREIAENCGANFMMSVRLKKVEERIFSLDGVFIHIIGFNDVNTASNVVVLLHGSPGSSEFFKKDWLRFEEHHICGIAIDMPGFGLSSQLPKLSSHSSNNLETNGPVDIVNKVMNAFCLPKINVFGFDWGGGIALSMAERFPSKVRSVVVFHAMTSSEKFKLKCRPTLLWVKTDQFHPLKLGRVLRAKTNGILHEFDVGRFKTGYDACYYSCHDKMVPIALEALNKGTDLCYLSRDSETLNHRESSSRNKKLNELFSKILHEPIEADALKNSHKWIALFKMFFTEHLLPHIYGIYLGKIPNSGRMKQLCIKLFSQLPSLYGCRDDVTAYQMEKLGIWSRPYSEFVHRQFSNNKRCPNKFDTLHTDRSSLEYFYPPERNVFFMTSGVSSKATDFCKLRSTTDEFGNASEKRERFRGRGKLKPSTSDNNSFYSVEVKCMGTSENEVIKQIWIPKKMIFEQNNPTWFKFRRGRMCLEDGLKTDYNSLLMKARLIELLFLVEGSKDQAEVVRKVKLMMNMTCIYEGIDRFRYCRCEDTAKLSVFGTGHCHGLTSVFASLLYPFQHMLGIYMRYTGGFHVKTKTDSTDVVELSNSIEHHQWLELTFYPSFELNIVDLVQAASDEKFVCYPTLQAYNDPSNILYGNGKLIVDSYI